MKMRKAIQSGRPCHVQVINYHKNGTPYWADIHLRPVYGYDGEIEFFFALEQEVTEEHERTEGMEGYILTLYQRLSLLMDCPVDKRERDADAPTMIG
jgi:hypothetical protein